METKEPNKDPSKATVISLCPFSIVAHKPGLTPGDFNIPASVNGEPQILVVGSSTFPVYLDSDRGSLRVPSPSFEVARSIAEDYKYSHLGIGEGAMPAIFHVAGQHSVADVKVKFAEEIKEALAQQRNWFLNLVKLADDDWNRHHRHAAISDMQRVACKALGMEREWLMVPPPETIGVTVIDCKMCGSILQQDSILCPVCKFVRKQKEYEGFKSAFATVGA